MAVPVYDQQERSTSLVLPDTAARFVIDDRNLWQSAHLTDGSRVVSSQTFGSFTDHEYEVRFVLLGLSKSAGGLNVALNALVGTGYVVIDDYNDRTLEVLTRYFQVKTNQEKNYDPALYAFAIRYHLTGVSDEDYAELPSDEEVAQLPVIVPEPEVIVVQPLPGTSGGGHYTHVQILPAAVWTITHNLGYNPAGIIVYDSANTQWCADNISYPDMNTVVLNFTPASFAGRAYLS